MQGRLSPAEEGRFQFFPTDWPAEFELAKNMGFDGICWFLDVDRPNFDPVKDIWQDPTTLEIIDRTIKTLPIAGIDCGWLDLDLLYDILPALAPRLSAGIAAIPLLEDKAPKSESDWDAAGLILKRLSAKAKTLQLRLALETELPAEKLKRFLDKLECGNVGVCYDIGNATSYGFDCPEEIRLLGAKIFEVHIKDRKVGGASFLLGEGDAKFADCFAALKEIGYGGGYTLQAWRGDDYLADAKLQLAFVKNGLNKI